jgi:hypothetical protein
MNGANSRGRNGNGSGGQQQQQVNVRVDVTINNDIDLGYQVVRVVLRNLLQSTVHCNNLNLFYFSLNYHQLLMLTLSTVTPSSVKYLLLLL